MKSIFSCFTKAMKNVTNESTVPSRYAPFWAIKINLAKSCSVIANANGARRCRQALPWRSQWGVEFFLA
jgi:hypothetical protein